jgi:biotin operon repressor
VGVRANSQNARVLRALADGGWHTSTHLRRATGTHVTKQVYELRQHGYKIEMRRQGNVIRYRLKKPLTAAETRRLVKGPGPPSLSLPRDNIPRTASNRFRIYRVVADKLDLVGVASSEGEFGEVVCRLAKDGAFAQSGVGLLDTHGSETQSGDWLLLPWDMN